MQNLFDDFFVLKKLYLILRNYGYSFHHFCGIMGHIFQTFAELWVQTFNQSGTPPPKIRLDANSFFRISSQNFWAAFLNI